MDADRARGLVEYRIEQAEKHLERVEKNIERLEREIDEMNATTATKNDIADLKKSIEQNRDLLEKKSETTNTRAWSVVGPIIVAVIVGALSAIGSYAAAIAAHVK
jgi:septal ring factor EnvC (AmiA/AmiB activator)